MSSDDQPDYIGALQDAKTGLGLAFEELRARAQHDDLEVDEHMKDVVEGLAHSLNDVKRFLNEHYYDESVQVELVEFDRDHDLVERGGTVKDDDQQDGQQPDELDKGDA